MEIQNYEEIRGVVTTANIVEGRMVLITSHSQSHDFGSREDLPGVKTPATSTEAGKARFILTWSVDNSPTPIYEPYPTLGTFALREGFDLTANVPFTAKVRLTHPGNQNSETIPSGYLALAFGRGTYKVPSGQYTYSASLVPGAFLAVGDTATDGAAASGKLKYSASAGFAEVVKVDDNMDLVFRILY